MSKELAKNQVVTGQGVQAEWFYSHYSVTSGPLSLSQLRIKLLQLEITEQTLVIKKGEKAWTKASDFLQTPEPSPQHLNDGMDDFKKTFKSSMNDINGLMQDNFENLRIKIEENARASGKLTTTKSDLDHAKVEADQQKSLEAFQVVSSSAQKNIELSENYQQRRQTLGAISMTDSSESKDFYFLHRGTLRIGCVRHPAKQGFLQTLTTLGLSSSLSLTVMWQEVSHHLNCGIRPPALYEKIFACIPVLSFFPFYSLFCMAKEMEKENGYSSISVAGSLFCSVLPPLAVWRLQKSLNSHWYMHVDLANK